MAHSPLHSIPSLILQGTTTPSFVKVPTSHLPSLLPPFTLLPSAHASISYAPRPLPPTGLTSLLTLLLSLTNGLKAFLTSAFISNTSLALSLSLTLGLFALLLLLWCFSARRKLHEERTRWKELLAERASQSAALGRASERVKLKAGSPSEGLRSAAEPLLQGRGLQAATADEGLQSRSGTHAWRGWVEGALFVGAAYSTKALLHTSTT
ncbi:MAG: hypothetical protein SGPRY_000369 [Prymnesium sp.]